MPPKRKRSSVTDSLLIDLEKLQSSVECGLISIEDDASMGRPGLGAGVVVVAHKGTMVCVQNTMKAVTQPSHWAFWTNGV